ncbi:hypothetical protein A6A40_29760 (plasmid) [Azospirillum humicireducens]|uniref:VWFA domain-containing protein n=1 Tax=Azospirillum humicireducens TaxID=1226968 RepID=A0A2R4VXM3_9PROT|nr:vWA domain-containing protein [Azospirillum humicireducens]AWB09147.1 hypothetical protein A6A40_29760 [Azospirillum humicireducens]
MTAMIILGLLILWVGSGWGLIAWFGRSRGKAVRRSVSRRIVGRGDIVTVTVAAEPPIRTEAVQNHDVVLLLDHSGSMGATPGSPLREMIRAASAFVRRLPDPIHVAVVSFDDAAECLCGFTGDKRRAIHAISAIQPGGGTQIGAALARAGELLDASRPDVKRTVILFSDGFDTVDDVLPHAEALRRHPAGPAVYCASFGGDETLALMSAVAGSSERVFLTARFDGLVALFTALAAEVSGQRAIAGLLDEVANAPRPFTVDDTGGAMPVDIRTAQGTSMSWPLPQFDGIPVPVTYGLQAHCLGWHPVVAERGRIAWRLPDGGMSSAEGPPANRVLVLPRWTGWIRPLDIVIATTLAHPLLMLALSRVLRCPSEPALPEAGKGMAADLAPAPLPPPVPVLGSPPFRPTLRPAVVIGLGRDGRAVVETLKEWLGERFGGNGGVALLALQVGPVREPGPGPGPGVMLDPQETLGLHADLWPMATALRGQALPDAWSWVPLACWFDRGQPLTTARGADGDRAKARAAGLANHDILRKAVLDRLAGRARHEVAVFAVGAADDAEATGLLADVAHVAAGEGHGVTALALAADAATGEKAGIAAFAREMERFLARREDPVVVERDGERHVARHLFDQMFVVGRPFDERRDRVEAAAALIWGLLASPALAERLPPPAPGLARGALARVHRVPQDALWRWVRERTLEEGVLRRWLGLEGQVDALVPAPLDGGLLNQLVTAFWSGPAAPQSVLLAGKVQSGEEPVGAFVYGGGYLPVDRPDHEQKAFCDRERILLGLYLESWCRRAIDEAAAKGRCPVGGMRAAVTILQTAMADLHARLLPYADRPESASFAAFGSSILLEARAMLSRLAASLAGWEAVFLSGGSRAPVPMSVAGALAEAGRDLDRWPGWEARVRPRLDAWFARQLPNLCDTLRFIPTWQPAEQTVSLRLGVFGASLTARDDIGQALRVGLDRYAQEVLSWPDEDWAQAHGAAGDSSWIGIGGAAPTVFGPGGDVVDAADPAIAIALSCDPAPVARLLHVSASADHAAFVWPEECNAARIACLIGNRQDREPAPFSPLAVSLLREPSALLAILVETAQGHLKEDADAVVLTRAGRRYPLALLTGDGLRLSDYEKALDQAVTMAAALDGTTLPAIDPYAALPQAWVADPKSFIAALEESPTGRLVRSEPGWTQWSDLAWGLCLDRMSRDMVCA